MVRAITPRKELLIAGSTDGPVHLYVLGLTTAGHCFPIYSSPGDLRTRSWRQSKLRRPVTHIHTHTTYRGSPAGNGLAFSVSPPPRYRRHSLERREVFIN